MNQPIESQLHKVLSMLSNEEKTKNRALERQTSRLVKALLLMKSIMSGSKLVIQGKR
jgi:hypothetical protein